MSFLQQKLKEALLKTFGEMDEPTLAAVASNFQWVDLQGGSPLFRQGDAGEAMYVLASGRLKITLDGSNETIAEIAPGEPVGEMALITGETRTANVLAVRDSILAKLEKKSFDELSEKHPSLLRNICKTIVQRFQKRQNRKRVKKKVTNLCVLPLADRQKTAQFLGDLVGALEKFGSQIVLDSHTVNRLLALPAISQIEKMDSHNSRHLSAWLEEQEAAHRFVIYIPDPTETAWTRRCLRQADEILLLADATQSPDLQEFEQKFLSERNRISLATQTLILLHPPETKQPSNTKSWLEKRPGVQHHHIRLGAVRDAERVARFITGTAVGLVLSGGAAKGIAHIGVIRALEEAGIQIDMVGGTSIGSVVGALVCIGWSGNEISHRTRATFRKNPTSDFNLLPITSIFKGRKLERLLDQFFGAQQIEDLWLNFYCISCNLSRTNPLTHYEGSVVEAIRASISIPGVFPPAILNNELHVDGGVFNNMPVDEMNKLGAGFIVAVDLQQYHHRRNSPPPLESPKMPNLLYIIMEATMLSGRYLTEVHKQDADLYFNPDTSGVGMLDWQRFDKIEQIGYDHARKLLAK